MRITDIILRKRDGERLSKEEIGFAVAGFASGKIPDYQFAALLMAIYFRKLDRQETLELTQAMIHSGRVMDLSGIKGPKVDKHSTGGVGDKTSLIVGPLVAAAGVRVAKLSGRGLGHTGGTIDKLESITGFSTEMSEEQFICRVNETGIAIGGQTQELVPADKKIYALRDVTCTVDNLSLIAASIMSKKIACGADKIVLDVKTGDGAFMGSPEEAFGLAKEMVDIGEGMGRETIAIVTDMDQPLGNAVGNSIEIIEAIDTLKGKGPKDLHRLCVEIGSHMLIAAKVCENRKEAALKLEELIRSGRAFDKFRAFIGSQGGNTEQIENVSGLPVSSFQADLSAETDGYISRLSARKIGWISVILGAGRETQESRIDHGAGIYLYRKKGDLVKKGDILARIFTANESVFNTVKQDILSAFQISRTKPEAVPLIYGIVSAQGTKRENIYSGEDL